MTDHSASPDLRAALEQLPRLDALRAALATPAAEPGLTLERLAEALEEPGTIYPASVPVDGMMVTRRVFAVAARLRVPASEEERG